MDLIGFSAAMRNCDRRSARAYSIRRSGLMLTQISTQVVWRVSNEVRIEQPVAVVFNYVTTAANWPRWHPASVAVKSIRGDVSKSGNIDD